MIENIVEFINESNITNEEVKHSASLIASELENLKIYPKTIAFSESLIKFYFPVNTIIVEIHLTDLNDSYQIRYTIDHKNFTQAYEESDQYNPAYKLKTILDFLNKMYSYDASKHRMLVLTYKAIEILLEVAEEDEIRINIDDITKEHRRLESEYLISIENSLFKSPISKKIKYLKIRSQGLDYIKAWMINGNLV